MPNYKLVVIPISSPSLFGVYEDNILIESFTSDKKISDSLLEIVDSCMKKYQLSSITYVNGPGSYMAIKLTYITLKTIEIIRDIECNACSGFLFNNQKPIKAIGNLYFIKEKDTIITKKFNQPVETYFELPKNINNLVLEKKSIPNYMLPAV